MHIERFQNQSKHIHIRHTLVVQIIAERAMLDAGVAAAREGVEYTKTIIATKGRASYLGERSIGHQDPGATSFTVILETIAEAY